MPNPSSYLQANALAGCGLVDWTGGSRPLTGTASRGLRFLGPVSAAVGVTMLAGQANRTCFGLQTEKVSATGPAVSIPGVADWAAGDVVVRLNISLANFNVDWVETRIWAIDDACAAITQLGIDTTVRSIGIAGVQTITIPISAISPGEKATLYIQFVFTNNNALMAQTFQILPNQIIDTPIVTPTKRIMMGVMH